MKTNIQLEETAITAIAIFFLTKFSLGLPIWIWIPLFLAPDISMLGYLGGNQTGAMVYNLFHHRGIALVVAALGMLFASNVVIATGILLFAHASFDRLCGMGLKFTDGFKHTHMDAFRK